ncbi:MAG: 30S ribosomal protein S1 [Thermodesulfovibrionales bacterium]|nr:30S ribosomal protein S1 [Thermodesulfovibrionales bacterium]
MDAQLKEEIKDMESFYEGTIQKIYGGEINQGKIVAVREDSFVVDVGYKSEGLIPKDEFTQAELENLKEGDFIDVFVERINEKEQSVSLSRKRARKIKTWELVVNYFKEGKNIEGTVESKIKGGYIFDFEGLKAFLPTSQLDIKTVKDQDAFIGKTLQVRILKLANNKNYKALLQDNPVMVVSRKVILEEERNKLKEETKQFIKEGMIVKGTVKNVTNYGVFVDLGGIDGLLHISDISWKRVTNASDYFKVGDESEFIVLKCDLEKEKITLGYKQKKPDPWIDVQSRYSEGMKVKGKVVSITDYGIFVELEEGLEGLVHLSELDWVPRPKHPSKYVAVGNEIEVIILSINEEARKLSLSLKQIKPKPWDLVGEKYKVGDIATGKIKTITDFGIFVRLPEGVDGLVHISDISWTKHIKHPSEIFRKGQKIETKVLNIDIPNERLALGIKQLKEDPWIKEIPARFQQGIQCKAKVLKITDFGIFVELQGGVDGVEGLIYANEIDHSIEPKEGDEIIVRVIKINLDDRKIGLSMKNIKRDED